MGGSDVGEQRLEEVSRSRRVGAVVVNHDAGDALLECVAELREQGVADVVVVDNASSDGSLARLAAVDRTAGLLPTGANLGYGRAANLGVRRLANEVVLVCNPDLRFEPGAVAALLRALDEEPDAAVVGPSILRLDRTRYPSARAFPSLLDAAGHATLGLVAPDNPFSRRYRLEEADLEQRKDVDWVSGACMAIRRVAFDSVGGFDESYFMYVEDLDVCWRLRRAAWRVVFEPAAVVVHAGGLSSRRHPYAMLAAHHRSTLRFFAKSAAGPERALLPVVAFGLGARLAVAAAIEATRGRRERGRGGEVVE